MVSCIIDEIYAYIQEYMFMDHELRLFICILGINHLVITNTVFIVGGYDKIKREYLGWLILSLAFS